MTQSPEYILLPVMALIIGTLVFTALMGLTRLKAARSGGVDYRIFKLYRNKENMPDSMLKISNHYDNLMASPILFYLIVILVYITENVDTLFILLAWIYVASRFVHSFVHLGKNHPLKRFFAFGIGILLLFVMAIKLTLIIVA